MDKIIKWIRNKNLNNSITTKLFSKCDKKCSFDKEKKLMKIIFSCDQQGTYGGPWWGKIETENQIELEMEWLKSMVIQYHFGDGVKLIKSHIAVYNIDYLKKSLTFKAAMLFDVSNMVENINLEEGVKDNMALAKATRNLRPDLRADELQKLVVELKDIISKYRKQP